MPEYLDVGWIKFKITLRENLIQGTDTCWGWTDFDNHEICIDPNISEQEARHTMIHEVAHALLTTVGLGDELLENKELTTTNEFLAESWARSMLILRNLNPELFNLLLVEESKDDD